MELHVDSLHGLKGYYVDGKLTFKNKNFTSVDYYQNTWMMSHFPKYWYFMTIGSRGRGKTFEGKQYSIKYILAQLENLEDRSKLRKFMWWRLTNDAVEKVKENSGRDFFEKHLQEQYGIRVRIVNSDIMFSLYDEDVVEVKWSDEDEKHTKTVLLTECEFYEKNYDAQIGKTQNVWFPVGKIASIQEYYKYKGNQLEEYDVVIMDELVRAESERRTFNIPKAFVNMIENVCRTRTGIRVMIFANAIGEMSEVKHLFGFMPLPGKFGVYKLYHKRAIIEYLDDSKEWKQEQAKTMAGVLRGNATEFTNVHVDPFDDKEDFFIARKHTAGKRYFMSLKIDRGLWLDIHSLKGLYYVDTDNYTSKKMAKQNRFALGRDLVTANTTYSKDYIKFIQEMWNLGKFRFSSKMCYEWFTKALDKYNII